MTDQKLIEQIRDPTKWSADVFELYDQTQPNLSDLEPDTYRDFCTAYATWKQKILELEHPKIFQVNKQPAQIDKPEDPLSTKLTAVSNIRELEPQWLVAGYIPANCITTLGGAGGAGKTTVICEVIAQVTTGRPCFMVPPIDAKTMEPQQPGNVLFFSSEDSFSYTLRRRLRNAGADLEKVFTMSLSDERFDSIKFGDDFLNMIIARYSPKLVVFDPIQSFLDADVNMGARNQMREALSSLMGLGELYGTSFILIAHSNKRENASGRDRLADSSDLWDASRSVLMMGLTKDKGIRYLSAEKNNYGPLGDTILFKLDNEKISVSGYTDRRDADFQAERKAVTSPARDEAKDIIVETLKSGAMRISELDDAVKACGVSPTALRRAKSELKDDGTVRMWSQGNGGQKQWFVELVK